MVYNFVQIEFWVFLCNLLVNLVQSGSWAVDVVEMRNFLSDSQKVVFGAVIVGDWFGVVNDPGAVDDELERVVAFVDV